MKTWIRIAALALLVAAGLGAMTTTTALEPTLAYGPHADPNGVGQLLA